MKLATGLSLGDMISYTITMKNGTIVVTINGASATQTYTTEFYGTTVSYYFKAGNYLQNSSTDANIYGLNQFYKLSLVKQTPTELIQINNKELIIYPNPAKNKIEINSPFSVSDNLNFQILDWSGKSVKSVDCVGNQTIDVTELPNGIYLAKSSSYSTIKTAKFIISK